MFHFFGTAWAESSSLADQRHAALEAAWLQERKDKDAEIAELVADLDRITTEEETAVAGMTSQVEALQTQLTEFSAQLDESHRAERNAARQAAESATKLAVVQARATAIQEEHQALLACVNPPEEPATAQ